MSPDEIIATFASEQAVTEHLNRLRAIWGDNDEQVRHHLYYAVRAKAQWEGGDEVAHRTALAAIWVAGQLSLPGD